MLSKDLFIIVIFINCCLNLNLQIHLRLEHLIHLRLEHVGFTIIIHVEYLITNKYINQTI